MLENLAKPPRLRAAPDLTWPDRTLKNQARVYATKA